MVTPLAVGYPVYKEHEKLSDNTRYQVIKANAFRDHRPAFAGPLTWTRPKQLDFKGSLILLKLQRLQHF